MAHIIAVHDLVKRFGATRALDGLDLEVDQGEIHGFLGPNGAGKTTTLRILLGMVRADGGLIELLGGDPWRDTVDLHRRLAYVPGDVSLWPNLSGGEVIDLLGRMRGGLDPQRRAALLERFALDPTKKGRSYSKGNRQKVALVAALASDVELLLLDEPTLGLDPLMEAAFRDCLREERDRGRTVLLSSHILGEVEALCDRVTIIRAGRTVETGALSALRHLTHTRIVAELAAPAPPGLLDLAGVHDAEVTGTTVRAHVEPEAIDGVLRALTRVGVRHLTSQPPSLEELFLRYYGGGDGRTAPDAKGDDARDDGDTVAGAARRDGDREARSSGAPSEMSARRP